jgi:hypothetical protein
MTEIVFLFSAGCKDYDDDDDDDDDDNNNNNNNNNNRLLKMKFKSHAIFSKFMTQRA